MTDDRRVTIYKPNEPTPIDKGARDVELSRASRPPKGVVDAVFTAFVADVERHSIDKITEHTKSLTKFTDAQAALADSRVKAGRAFGALRDLPKTLDDDQADRDDTRAAKAHQRELAERARKADAERFAMKQEIEDLELQARLAKAKHLLNAAQHGVENFVASTESRIKQTSDVWAAKAFAAEAERNEHAKVAHGVEPTVQTNNHLDAHLQQLHDALDSAVADGDHDKAERLRRAIAALSEI